MDLTTDYADNTDSWSQFWLDTQP